MPSSRPELSSLLLSGTPDPWQRLGFAVEHDEIHVGGVRLRFGFEGEGLVDWMFDGDSAPPAEHPNRITAIDHVVALTDDLDAKVAELRELGLDFRRTRDAGNGISQAFFVLGPCLLELAGPVDDVHGMTFWGITFVGEDLERFGAPKDAVQPGRRIVTVSREAGLGFPVAVMSAR